MVFDNIFVEWVMFSSLRKFGLVTYVWLAEFNTIKESHEKKARYEIFFSNQTEKIYANCIVTKHCQKLTKIILNHFFILL